MPSRLRAAQKNRLREVRQGQNLPQWALAVRARTTATMLSAIERWGYKPGVDLQERIAKALGVTVVDIWPEVLHEQS